MLLRINGTSASPTNQPKPTMKLITRVAAFALTAVAASTALKAENNADQQNVADQTAAATKDYSTKSTNSVATGKDVKAPVVAAAPASPMFNLNVSENYDSRYMFRGVDVLAGTGILSTTFDPIWHITANDTISVPIWFATAVKSNAAQSAYRELDIPVSYTHAIGQWTLGAGYQLYNYFNAPSINGGSPAHQGEQNEVNENVAYTYTNSIGSFTPSITYYQELGTAYGNPYGSVNPGSSFLSPALAAAIPLTFIKKDGSVTFNPNTQLNFGFRYNNNAQGQAQTGLNNWQFQLPVTWQITKVWSATGYWAYSYQDTGLASGTVKTGNSLGWAGASIGASF